MPPQTSYDVLNEPPRPVEHQFELAARRLTETWLAEGRVAASAADLRIAAEFLKRCGLTAEVLPGLEVRLVSPQGRATITTREGAVVTALRCLVALDAQHAGTSAPTARAA